jgi:hypothetical protein
MLSHEQKIQVIDIQANSPELFAKWGIYGTAPRQKATYPQAGKTIKAVTGG